MYSPTPGNTTADAFSSQKQGLSFPCVPELFGLQCSFRRFPFRFTEPLSPQAPPSYEESNVPDLCFDRRWATGPLCITGWISIGLVWSFGVGPRASSGRASCFRAWSVGCLSRVEVRQVEFGGLVHCPFRFEEKNARAKGHDAR